MKRNNQLFILIIICLTVQNNKFDCVFIMPSRLYLNGLLLIHEHPCIIKSLQMEPIQYLLVVGVLSTNPIRVVSLDLVPGPVSKVRVESSSWVEPVTGLNHLCWVSSLDDPSVDDVPLGEVLVDDVEVLESVLLLDLFVDLG